MNAQNELREYLGNKWEPEWTVWTNERLNKELGRFKDSHDFHRHSKYATYLLASNIVSEWREPYLAFVRETVPPCEMLEYHAGVGGFGLRLYDGYGYAPAFADYQTKSLPFLKWRLKLRGLKTDLFDLDKDEIPRYPLAICFDALERYELKQRAALIDRLAELGRMVIFNADSRNVEVPALLEQVGERLVKHRVINVYVNLIAFRSEEFKNGSSRT